MDKGTICIDCKAVGAEADTRYTLIGSGWRVTRRQTAQGVVVDWRCSTCWSVFKRSSGRHQRADSVKG